MDYARAVLERLVKGLEDKDLDAVVSCWHPEVETVHLLRVYPDWPRRDGLSMDGWVQGINGSA